ncbi:MAG TPA: hypothetical protein ENN54_05425 [Thermoplasmatales archaeon]|nr:hypothetical protein [Thermoplasmatales archaeon]
MKDDSMAEKNTAKAFALIVALIILGTIVGLALAYGTVAVEEREVQRRGPWPREEPVPRSVVLRYLASSVVITVNVFLLIGLLYIYMKTYTQTRSSFMLGLIFFIGVLLIQSVLSLPPIHALFGYTMYGLGPFGLLPHLFESLALIILIVLSME